MRQSLAEQMNSNRSSRGVEKTDYRLSDPLVKFFDAFRLNYLLFTGQITSSGKEIIELVNILEENLLMKNNNDLRIQSAFSEHSTSRRNELVTKWKATPELQAPIERLVKRTLLRYYD